MPKSVVCADVVMRSIIEAHYTPNRTVADLPDLTRIGRGVDPLREFSAAAGDELHRFAML